MSIRLPPHILWRQSIPGRLMGSDLVDNSKLCPNHLGVGFLRYRNRLPHDQSMDHMAGIKKGSQNAVICSRGSSNSSLRWGKLGNYKMSQAPLVAATLHHLLNPLPQSLIFRVFHLAPVRNYKKAPHLEGNVSPKGQGSMCAHTVEDHVQNPASSKNISAPTQEKDPIRVSLVVSHLRLKVTCTNIVNPMPIELKLAWHLDVKNTVSVELKVVQ